MMKIDVDAVLKQRLKKKYRYIPKWAVKWLARTIKQDELNVILQHMAQSPGVDAADAALKDLGVGINTQGNIPDEGRFLFVSNHPLGGLDGLCLISCLGHHYNGKIRFIVNDLLMAVKPLQSIFLPVNKFGRQSRTSAAAIETEYEGDKQMITFPAGLCSRMQKHGVIADLEWSKFIVTQAVKSKRDIIPIFFEGVNSKSFYRRAKWR
ncbi:MAG: 1-acyl-sn-glycerol-3-phosphate acyltransferase, partial [Muribaculaceae bacterium]|nr:1-acyl-sn-glycerol-3-phosphate acyltransferase [Muribaculaceae bacterium]